MSSSSHSSSSRRRSVDNPAATSPSSSSSSSSSSPIPRRLGVPAALLAASSSQLTPSSSGAATPMSPAPLPTVAALPDGARRLRGKFDSIVRPTGLPSCATAADLDMARFLLGPSAIVVAAEGRPIHNPPEGHVGIHLHSVAFGFRVPPCPHDSDSTSSDEAVVPTPEMADRAEKMRRRLTQRASGTAVASSSQPSPAPRSTPPPSRDVVDLTPSPVVSPTRQPPPPPSESPSSKPPAEQTDTPAPNKIRLSHEVDEDAQIWQGNSSVRKWAANVLLPKDVATTGALGDEYIVEASLR
ncbi:PREDICTED: flocculation protein FLO11-like [Ipomoea nil]|uniref:flocculation protein FLO11-like n=1 Tax=Ipomoea nil TaxID=35883 RepID=UPI000901770F|nr:PREDICTED: flocculation protein FLO11-like [Ipomoea nil]